MNSYTTILTLAAVLLVTALLLVLATAMVMVLTRENRQQADTIEAKARKVASLELTVAELSADLRRHSLARPEPAAFAVLRRLAARPARMPIVLTVREDTPDDHSALADAGRAATR